jgi:hypothetical protein
MWQEAVRDRGLQMYDNAAHGMDGVRMADDLRRGSLGSFLRHLHERTVWPPALPLLEVPGFLIFGPDYDTAERQMVVFGFLGLLAAAAAGLALGGARGVSVAAVLVASIASSPFYARFMMEVMIEGPAVAAWLASMAFYARWVRLGRGADAALCCLFGLVLFMLKFNLGILWLAPLLIHEGWRAGVRPRALRDLWGARLRIPPFWRVYAIVVLLAGLALLARLFDRGWGPSGLSHAVARAGSHGLTIPVLVVAGLVFLPFALRPRATFHAAGSVWLAAGPFGRAFLAVVVVPTAAWFAVPSHAKGLLHFLAGRTPEIPIWSAEGLLYYPRVFLSDYAAHPALGLAALLLAPVSLALLPRLAPAERAIPLALVIQCALVTLHPVKGDRYFYTVAPVVWMAAALTVAVLAEAAARRIARPGLAPALAVAALAAVLVMGPDLARVRTTLERTHVHESVRRLLDAIADVNVASRGTVLFGTWNRLAPPLAEWHQRLRHPDRAAPPRPKNPSWFDTEEAGALLDGIAADPEVERVIVLELRDGYAESSSRFEFENGWHRPAREALASDARFLLENRAGFDDSGYVLTVYLKRDAGV